MAKRRATMGHLTRLQRKNLVIGRQCGGVGRPEWAFESEAARKAAWEQHKEELLASSRPGRRPAAYWDYYDGGDPRIPYETNLQALDRLGLLRPDEIEYFEAYHPGALPTSPATGKDPRTLLPELADR